MSSKVTCNTSADVTDVGAVLNCLDGVTSREATTDQTITIAVKLEVWSIDLPRLNDTNAFNTAFRFGSDMSSFYPSGTPSERQWADWMPFLVK
jgi:hypothetical protein